MARCPGCNKFASVEQGDPEVDLSIDGITVRATLRLNLITDCCSEEVKETTLEPEIEIPIDADTFGGHIDLKTHEGLTDNEDVDHELVVEEAGVEVFDRTEKKVTSYGARVNFEVRCTCQAPADPPLYEGHLEAEERASDMEEIG